MLLFICPQHPQTSNHPLLDWRPFAVNLPESPLAALWPSMHQNNTLLHLPSSKNSPPSLLCLDRSLNISANLVSSSVLSSSATLPPVSCRSAAGRRGTVNCNSPVWLRTMISEDSDAETVLSLEEPGSTKFVTHADVDVLVG